MILSCQYGAKFFQHLVVSIYKELILKTKLGLAKYLQGVPSKGPVECSWIIFLGLGVI